MAAAVGREKRGKSSVLIQAIKKRNDYGQAAAAEYVRTENPVFTTKNEKRNQNPKSRVALREAIHKKPPVLYRRGYVIDRDACGFVFSTT